jgi:hypothetical protein
MKILMAITLGFIGGILFQNIVGNDVLQPSSVDVPASNAYQIDSEKNNTPSNNKFVTESPIADEAIVKSEPISSREENGNCDKQMEKEIEASVAEVLKDMDQGKKFADYLMSKSSDKDYSLSADLEGNFNSEEVDYEWSLQREKTLSEVFASGELSEYLPQSIICKSESCEIKIPLLDVSSSSAVSSLLYEALSSGKYGSEPAALYSAVDTDAAVINLYVARNSEIKLYE